MPKYKEYGLIKSAEADAGTITGYFSTYDRIPDSYGDIVAPGAFTETIKKREESGHPFPLCWNHDLNMIIGKVDKIEDDEKGPLMTASFFGTPLAQEKRELVKSGVVFQFSFAYDILEAGPTEIEEGVKAYELKKLDLFEVSIVPIPANPRAEMTEIKSGARNSKKDAADIKEAIKLLQGVLGELEEAGDPEDGEDNAKANAGAKEPEQSNPTKKALLAYINDLKTEV